MTPERKLALIAETKANPGKVLELPIETACKFTVAIGKTDKLLYAELCEVLHNHYGELATFHLINILDELEKTGKLVA